MKAPNPRPQVTRGLPRPLRVAAVVLFSLYGAYLLAANIALSHGLIYDPVNRATPQLKMKWESAYTLWPGRVTVSGFTMRFDDDHMVQLDVKAEKSTADISFTSLFQRHIRFTRVRASGVSYRMSLKVDAATAKASPERIAAFPVVPGFPSPPVKPEGSGPPMTAEDIDRLWQVQVDDSASDMNEVWINEFRYLGPAHAEGSFLLAPLKLLQVGPALILFRGGRFSVGEHVIASRLDATVASTIAPVDLSHVSADALLGAVSASIRCDSRIDDLSAAQLYLDGVTLHGEGPLTIDLVVVSGKVTADSTVKLKIERLEGRASGFAFSGTTELLVSVSPRDKLQAQATLAALLSTPPLDGEPMKVRVERATLDALMSSSNLGASPAFERLNARADDVRADDARPVVRLATRYVPIIAPAVLGAGPLTASVTATVTPEYALLRLNASKLGSANMSGALMHASQKWNGAAAGHFDQLALGLQVVDSVLHYHPFEGDDWLEKELKRIGIHVGPPSAATPPLDAQPVR